MANRNIAGKASEKADTTNAGSASDTGEQGRFGVIADAVHAEMGEHASEAVGPHPRNDLNDLTGREWIQETKSVWFQKGLGAQHPEARIERLHPAPFSFQDVGRLIAFFTKQGQTVLDPFCGVGSTLKACLRLGRRGVGIELMEVWADLTRKRLETECGSLDGQEIITGDARDVLPTFASESVNFVITSPPYWGILNKKPDHKLLAERVGNGLATHYSEVATRTEASKDLANIVDYHEFLKQLVQVFDQCLRTLETNRYLAIVVSDFRHKGVFVPFHADLITAMSQLGEKRAVLKGITILAQNQKRLYPYGYPYGYVPNMHHQYILIFRKESAFGD
ncbi:MAG: DNA methyltransferase [Actinomycetota bacterium]